jgi:hypothetical protein
MKIKDLLGEDDFGKIAAVTGDKITIDKPDGTKVDVAKKALMPDPSNPNAVTIDPNAAGGLKPGMDVDTTTQEEVEVGGDPTDDFIDDVVDDTYGVQEDESDVGTMPTTEYVKGIYSVAAQNGMAAPEVEAVKKQMVLAPNGEVDIMATMQKALAALQSPELQKMLKDLDDLVKKAEAQQGASQATPTSAPDQSSQTTMEEADNKLLQQMKNIAGINTTTSKPSYSKDLTRYLQIAGLR